LNDGQFNLENKEVYCRKSEVYGCEDLACKWNFAHKSAYTTDYECHIMHCKKDRKE
jgi:hypothetical protein